MINNDLFMKALFNILIYDDKDYEDDEEYGRDLDQLIAECDFNEDIICRAIQVVKGYFNYRDTGEMDEATSQLIDEWRTKSSSF